MIHVKDEDITIVKRDLNEKHKKVISKRREEEKRKTLIKRINRGSTKPKARIKKPVKRRGICDIKPVGTMEELSDAYTRALEYEVKMVDYSSREEIMTKEELETIRRIIHFNKQGPTYKKAIEDKYGKLMHADVLYILSDKHPAHVLAELFNVSKETILCLKRGEFPQWKEEYHLVRRLRRSTICKLKKFFDKPFITVLTDVKGAKNFYFTSPRKAEVFRQDYVVQRIPKTISQGDSNAIVYARLVKSGRIDEIFPIVEEMILK